MGVWAGVRSASRSTRSGSADPGPAEGLARIMRFRLLPRNLSVGWTPYVWLVYLGTVAFGPILGRTSAAG